MTTKQSTQDYFPFGSLLPGRGVDQGEYERGFNGQEQDKEVYGEGNAYTATFWEYDPRLGRRWNLDPKPDVETSGYVCLGDNPILNIDPNGAYFFGLFGSTSAQRRAAAQLAKEKGGEVINKHSKNICVSYTAQLGTNVRTGEAIMGIFDQYFKKDGSLVPINGEIMEAGNDFKNAEMWLGSESQDAFESAVKIAGNMLYSLPNSVSILVRGETIAGSDAVEQKTDAFVDVAPSLVGLMVEGVSLRVTKSALGGFNQFLKKSPGLLKGRTREMMMKDASILYKINKGLRNQKETLNSVNEIKEAAEKTNNEVNK